MGYRMTLLTVLMVTLLLGGLMACKISTQPQSAQPPERLDVPYEPTHPEVVKAMLKLAKVGHDDVVYDLGCGDGRIVVAAVKEFGARRGVGIDIDPQRIREAQENAQRARVTDRVRFIVGDIMEAQFTDATVVTLYLLPEINVRIRPLLFQQLSPGARVVSHAFDMDDWEPDKTERHQKARNNRIYLWVIPAHAGGKWSWTTPIGEKQVAFSMTIEQEFQAISAKLSAEGSSPISARAVLDGKHITLEANLTVGGEQATVRYNGIIDGDRITGTQIWQAGPLSGTHQWVAQREPVDPTGTWEITAQSSGLPIPQGKLAIRRNSDGMLTAEYSDARSIGRQRIWHFYIWGASLRFDIRLSNNIPAIFKGFIEGDTMRGRTIFQNIYESKWTAKRISN